MTEPFSCLDCFSFTILSIAYEISGVLGKQDRSVKGQGIQTGGVGVGASAPSTLCPSHKEQGPVT